MACENLFCQFASNGVCLTQDFLTNPNFRQDIKDAKRWFANCDPEQHLKLIQKYGLPEKWTLKSIREVNSRT